MYKLGLVFLIISGIMFCGMLVYLAYQINPLYGYVMLMCELFFIGLSLALR